MKSSPRRQRRIPNRQQQGGGYPPEILAAAQKCATRFNVTVRVVLTEALAHYMGLKLEEEDQVHPHQKRPLKLVANR